MFSGLGSTLLTVRVPIVILILGIFASMVKIFGVPSDIGSSSEEVQTKTAGSSLSASKPWRRDLAPSTDGWGASEIEQRRLRPFRVLAQESKAFVSLLGREAFPGRQILVFDLASPTKQRRIEVGLGPVGMALHPNGRHLVVVNRFSNYASVIDTEFERVVSEFPVPFYCEEVVISSDGDRAYLSNFFLNQVLVVNLSHDWDGLLVGKVHKVGLTQESFFGHPVREETHWHRCDFCGWRSQKESVCRQCGRSMVPYVEDIWSYSTNRVATVLRGRCGTSDCHLSTRAGFYAGPDEAQLFLSAKAYSYPQRPTQSPILKTVIPTAIGGWADDLGGKHHPGGIVFQKDSDPDYQSIAKWIALGQDGPGVAVGNKPRNMALSEDGKVLYVANTGSQDISVVDTVKLREERRIFLRSPVNDLIVYKDHLIATTLGIGSGHPKSGIPAGSLWTRQLQRQNLPCFETIERASLYL